MRRSILGLGLAALALAVTPVLAADTFTIDPVHSAVVFKVQHNGAGNVWGRFKDLSGSFTVDAGAQSSVSIEIKTDSIDTNNPKRDGHLKSPDFFNAAQFATITFKSTAVKKIDDKTVEVTGDLNLHGVTKPVTVKMLKTGTAKDREGNAVLGWEGSFTIKRSDFGMTNMIGPAGDEIMVTVSIEGGMQKK